MTTNIFGYNRPIDTQIIDQISSYISRLRAIEGLIASAAPAGNLDAVSPDDLSELLADIHAGLTSGLDALIKANAPKAA